MREIRCTQHTDCIQVDVLKGDNTFIGRGHLTCHLCGGKLVEHPGIQRCAFPVVEGLAAELREQEFIENQQAQGRYDLGPDGRDF